MFSAYIIVLFIQKIHFILNTVSSRKALTDNRSNLIAFSAINGYVDLRGNDFASMQISD